MYLCENAEAMLMDKATSVVISDILASACGDLQPAMRAVAQLANQELVPGGSNGKVCGQCLSLIWFIYCRLHYQTILIYWRSILTVHICHY